MAIQMAWGRGEGCSCARTKARGSFRRVLTGLVLAIGSALAPTAWASPLAEPSGCGARPAAPSVPTYLLLIGHADPPAGSDLARLSAVDDDIRHMAAFFRPWAPRRTIMLFDPPLIARPALRQADVRRPTWSEVRRAVAELVEELRAGSGPRRIYVYYAGHGERYRTGPHARTRLFLAPEPDRSGPGHDGVLDPDLLASEVLGPLAAYGTVHFIADACQSWFLLESRAVSRRQRVFKLHPGADADMALTFARRYPAVGALLATNGSQSTYEDPTLGGLFSHALRSAALGLADIDRDGIITYGEMEWALSWILAGRAGVASPGVMGPSADPGAPFIDLASAVDGAHVCLDPRSAGRRELLTEERVPFATLTHGDRPTPVVLERGRRWYTREGVRWSTFTARDADLSALLRGASDALVARGRVFSALFASVLPSERAPVLPGADAPWRPRPYVALGVSLRGQAYLDGGPTGADGALGGDLTLRAGAGADQLGIELGLRSFAGSYNEGAIDLETQVYGLRAAYGRVLLDHRVEVTAGLDVGVGFARSTEGGFNRSYWSTVPEGALRLTLHLPVPAGQRPAVRVDVRGGALGFDLSDRWSLHTFVEAGVGFDWELGFE